MASISGPSSITINSLPATWTASGFSDPDQIEWDFTGAADASGLGNTFTITSISNKNQTFTITAKQGSTSASKSVKVTKVDIPVTSFSVSPSSVSVYNGSYTSVSYSYSPSNATSGTLPSLSSGGSHCSVSISKGSIRITGTSVGSETLTFSNSNGVSFNVSVTVKSSGSSTTTVTSMSVSTSSITVMEGQTGSFTVTVSPSTATNKDISASNSGDEEYYSVSKTRSGATTTVTVRGLKYSAGRCRLLITALGGSISSQYVDVYVTKAPSYVTSFYTSIDNPHYISQNQQVSFKVTAQPSSADNTSWTHSVTQGSDIATVNRLSSPANTISVVPRASGTVVIQLRANDAGGHTETRTIIIDDNILVSALYVNYQGEITEDANIYSISVAEGRYDDFYVITRPTNATDPSVTITNQGGTGEVSITQLKDYPSMYQYRVTGVKQGQVTLLITTNDDSDLEYTLTIYINEKVNDDFPYDLLQYHTVYPFEEAEEYLLDTRYTIVDSTYKVHAGYVDSPLDLKGMYIPLDGQNITSLPAFDSAAESKVGIWLQGMHEFFIREFYIYVTNANNQTVANKITVRKRGDFVKTLRYNKNPPSGVTVTGTLPQTVTYDGTGDTVDYIFKIPESNLAAKGYVFIGWREYNDNTPCTVYNAGDKYKMRGGDMDITLYAEWFPIPKGATGTGSLDDPFAWVIDTEETALNITVPNVGDYPITYRGTFPEVVSDGVVVTANGTEYATIDRISLGSGVMTITGEPEDGFEKFRFVQIGQRAYQIDFNLTVITPNTPVDPSEPTGKAAVVTYNPNGGTMTVRSVKTNVGSTIVLPDATYTGKFLVGWQTPAGDYVGVPGDRYLVPGSITLSAQWKVASVEPAKCYLAASHNGVDETMYFDLVDSIDDTMTSNLSSYSTLVFGAANRYIIDLGNSRRFSINIVRDNPPNYNDSSTDQRRWSNGKWLREFLNFIDFWQNFGRDPRTGKNTGGMRFYFEPPAEAKELYPVIDKNVFISGTITPSYSGPQKIQLSIPLQVASMAVSSAGDPSESVTYKSAITGMSPVTQTFVKGSTVSILAAPAEWEAYSKESMLRYWRDTSGKIYYPLESAKLTSGTVLTAVWDTPESVVLTSNGAYTLNYDCVMTVYAVGGGGSGSSRHDTEKLPFTGGAGGAGRMRSVTLRCDSGQIVSVTIGAGAEADSVSGLTSSGFADGNDGEDTIVKLGDIEILAAEGGGGGKKAVNGNRVTVGKGGAGWGPGGSTSGDGEDGQTEAPNTKDYVGKGRPGGWTQYNNNIPKLFSGGAGGGASALNITLPDGARYISRGGNGGTVGPDQDSAVTPPGDGKYGGGGGSGPYGKGGSGGDGIVILLLYKV
ncbi:MAG: InlB B-repeat-containing protein [Candidatus Methanomethylophilaceae archaeon]|nr:InlB B-repeat-containing protein [Candidatus Methanomethylophilaceae archaeon]